MPDYSRRSRPLRVVHVLDTEGYAGRESVVESLASAQLSAGFDVSVAAVVEQGKESPPFVVAAREAGIPLDVLRLRPHAYLTERGRIAELLEAHDADVMHSHGYRPDVVAGSAAQLTDAARVSTVHGFVGGGWKNRLYERLQRWSLRRFDRVVGVSTGVASELVEHGVPRDRVEVIRNAWNGSDEFLPRDRGRELLGVGDGRFLVGWVGRLSSEKGPDVLLDALRECRQDGVSVSFIGEGPMEQALIRRSRELPAGIKVQWHGEIQAAFRLFRAFDVFAISSRSEGTPMVLLEAMAAGVPVVTTTVGGIPDVVTGEEAVLVPPDDPDALLEGVLAVNQNQEEARARVSAAAERLETEFGVDQWVSRYEKAYRTALRACDE